MATHPKTARRLQHKLTVFLNDAWHERLAQKLGNTGRVRIRSEGAFNSGAKFTCLPLVGQRVLRAGDRAMSTALRLRVGLYQPPPEGMPSECPCGADLRQHPTHGLWCPKLKRREVLMRHNGVAQAIADIVTHIGGAAEVEPTGYSFHDGKTADLRIMLGDREMLLDVAVRDPLAPSVVATKAAMEKEGLIGKAEKEKRDKYAEECERNGIEFHPVVFEPSGHLGDSGQEVFAAIAQFADRLDNGFSARYVMGRLLTTSAMAIMKGNHLILEACMRQIGRWHRAGKPPAFKNFSKRTSSEFYFRQ
jgi:hypothetical protein